MSDGTAAAAAPAPPLIDSAVPGAGAPPRRRSYVLRHWRGELSLPVSYWVNFVLLGLVGFGIGFAASDVAADLRDPRLLLALGVALIVFGLTLPVWQIVGVWRSAGHHRARGGRGFWAIVARVLMVLGVLRLLGVVGTEVVPQLPVFSAIALGDRGMTHELRLLDDGGELLFAGQIGFGLSGEITALLDAHPEVKRIRLSSVGGRVLEARRLHDVIRSRGLDTAATGLCASACTIAFMGGTQRLIAPAARLGFHQGNVPGGTAIDRALQNRRDKRLLLEDGVDAAFVERAYATPNAEVWYPTPEELLRAGFATAIMGAGAAPGSAPRAAAAASDDHAGVPGFGLYGSWAVDCRAPASPANSILSLTPIASGGVAYHLSMGGSPPDFETPVRDLRVTDREIAFSVPVSGKVQHVVLSKSGDRLRSMQSHSDDGRVVVKDGINLASGKETPSLERCAPRDAQQ
jgi:ATP-dependent protease ClpP protease subunit